MKLGKTRTHTDTPTQSSQGVLAYELQPHTEPNNLSLYH